MVRKITEARRRSSREHIHRMRLKNKERLREYKRDHPCVDCGEVGVLCLVFDHVRGEKIHRINYMMKASYTWTTIKREISKCEVRCKTCHDRRHGRPR